MSTLWLVATPIGNMDDLAPRALDVLGRVALVCCEDTRRTGLLLQRSGIRAERLAVCNEHTELRCAHEVLAVLDRGDDVALVSDAGSPGISDPGEHVVRAVVEHGHVVSGVPGPTAAVMALTISGLPSGRFVFEGFLPRKGRERTDRLAEIAREPRTTVLYEAPHRVRRTLADLRSACGADRMVVVTRELTKLHEETFVGTAAEAIEHFEAPRGEFVLVIEGGEVEKPELDIAAVEEELAEMKRLGLSRSQAQPLIQRRFGIGRRRFYEMWVAQG